MARRPIDLMKAVEHEIAQEKAFSLGRVGARLEELLRELRELGAAAAGAQSDEERAACVEAFNACRQRAAESYYALTIQREAMGVKHHEILAAMYPIPPKMT
ncbi:MAG: hypothetical protein LC659_13985 [Myxococcales bacterium]|nr:hypothetical protein [Myxococcales bacterium]